MRGALGLVLLCAASEATAGPIADVVVDVKESSSGDAALHVAETLAISLGKAGWRVGRQTDAGTPPHCLVRGSVTSQRLGADVAVQYALEVLTETGAPLASASGALAHARPTNARAQAVNALLSQLTAGLAAHPMPDAVSIEGVEDDGQARSIAQAFSSLPGTRGVSDEHLSNGALTLTVATRKPASALPELLTAYAVAGKHLDVTYAGVDLFSARLR